MIGYEELQDKIKKGDMSNCYILSGMDEKTIKDSIQLICDSCISKEFLDLNYRKFDGSTIDFETLVNACETMPFLSEKKVVVVYRASFLLDNRAKDVKVQKQGEILKKIEKYVDSMPSHCILIIYYVLQGPREKVKDKLKSKNVTAVQFVKPKGAALERLVQKQFKDLGKNIGKAELQLFCSLVDSSSENIYNEALKLCAYVMDKEIKSKDILLILPRKSDNDIFNLVDCISQKKAEKVIDILNELIHGGEKINNILSMIERQFKLLLLIKLSLENGGTKDSIARELSLNPYICEKMIAQSRRFRVEGIEQAIESCLHTERLLKNSSLDPKTEMELLIINTLKA